MKYFIVISIFYFLQTTVIFASDNQSSKYRHNAMGARVMHFKLVGKVDHSNNVKAEVDLNNQDADYIARDQAIQVRGPAIISP